MDRHDQSHETHTEEQKDWLDSELGSTQRVPERTAAPEKSRPLSVACSLALSEGSSGRLDRRGRVSVHRRVDLERQ